MIDLLPNETLPILWLIFVFVYWVLNRFVFQPTLQLLEDRENKTVGLTEDVERVLQQTKEAQKEYEQKIFKARQLASLERERVVNQGRDEQRNIIGQAKKENENLLDQMQALIKQEKSEASLKLRQYSQGLASDIANKILEREVA